MPLNLFYITNDPNIAVIAEKSGVDRIWIDLETLGKDNRQHGINTVKSNHTVADISAVKPVLKKSKLLVRVNPWNPGSIDEINAVIDAGADIIMLPYWKTVKEVKSFLDTVGKRCRTTLLLETKEAVECVDEVLTLDFDEIHIGLNDLHLSYGKDFMFELLADGTVDALCEKFRAKGILYGFGGIARLDHGLVPSEKIIMEHYRLGSTRAILSRSFCDVEKHIAGGVDYATIEEFFRKNMKKIREYEAVCLNSDDKEKEKNRLAVLDRVREVVKMKLYDEE